MFAGGKCYGGRMASMAVAEGMPAAGLVFLGYPLHAPGKPDSVRDEHLYGIEVPMLFLQGTKDPFADPECSPACSRKLGTVRRTYPSRAAGTRSSVAQGQRARQRGARWRRFVAAFVEEHS